MDNPISLNNNTTVDELLKHRHISVRTRNVCKRMNLLTIKDIQDYYFTHQTFKGLFNIGNKSSAELLGFCRHSKVIPIVGDAAGGAAPSFLKEVTIATVFYSFDEHTKIIAADFYAGYINRLASKSKNKLIDLCGGNTLQALAGKLLVQPSLFKPFFNTTKNGAYGDIAKLLTDISRFYAGESFAVYKAQPGLVLLKKEMNKLLKCTGAGSMNAFLDKHFDTLKTGDFPIAEFIDIAVKINTVLHPDMKQRLAIAKVSCPEEEAFTMPEMNAKLNLRPGAIWATLNKPTVFRLLRKAIALLKEHGLLLPPSYMLAGAPCRAYQVKGKKTYGFFNEVFMALLLNPGYCRIECYIQQRTIVLLAAPWLPGQLDIVSFLEAIDKLKNACVRSACSIHPAEVIAPFYKKNLSAEEQHRLSAIAASMLHDLYGITLNAEGAIELSRINKKVQWEFIYDILKEKGAPCRIPEVNEKLRECGVSISCHTVRSAVFQHPAIFTLAGRSTVGLKEWKAQSVVIDGTIKQYIIAFLSAAGEPKHMYEVAEYVRQHCNAAWRSVRARIELNIDETLVSFGNMFIGLKGKEYHPAVTLFNPVHKCWFAKVQELFTASNKKSISKEEIVNHIAGIYNVKKIQVEYLLSYGRHTQKLIPAAEGFWQLNEA